MRRCGGEQYRRLHLLNLGLLVSIALLLFFLAAHKRSGQRATLKLSLKSWRQPGTADELPQPELLPDEDGLFSSLIYISDPKAAARLHCPLNHTLGCFYKFDAAQAAFKPPINGSIVREEDCTTVRGPLHPDKGRRWCLRVGREPDWLHLMVPESRHQRYHNTVLLTGKLDGPNPTHQANLHFLGVWKWMRRVHIRPGELSTIVDYGDRDWAPGKFGAGLALALGTLDWLPDLDPGLVAFNKLQFSIPDSYHFPFDLGFHTIDIEVDVGYVEFAQNVKARVLSGLGAQSPPKIEPKQPDQRRPRVLLAKRRPSDSRIWENAAEVARHLGREFPVEAHVATLGDLSFAEQVELVSSCDVLVGVTGSDLVNMMFLPWEGSVVEIFPYFNGEEVFVPELSNMAGLLGKNHFTYISTGKVVVTEEQELPVHRAKRATTGVADLAALIRHAAHQGTTGSSLAQHFCTDRDGFIQCFKASSMDAIPPE